MLTTRTMGWMSAALLVAGAVTWLVKRRRGPQISWRRASRRLMSEAARWLGRQLLNV